MPVPGLPVLHGIRRTLSTLAARIYLTACVLLLGWALLAASEGSMAITIPMFATTPSSLLLLLLLPENDATSLLSIMLGALTNATIIGWCHLTLSEHKPNKTH